MQHMQTYNLFDKIHVFSQVSFANLRSSISAHIVKIIRKLLKKNEKVCAKIMYKFSKAAW